MSFADHRKQLMAALKENSIAVVYAGKSSHTNEDDYYDFRVNSQFFWLTGLDREGMILMMVKAGGKEEITLFIDEVDPLTVRWTGKMPTIEDARAVSAIEDIRYTDAFANILNRKMKGIDIQHAYFETWKNDQEDLPDWNAVKAKEFMARNPSVAMHDLHNLISPMRRVKDEMEVERIKKAIDMTRQGLENVMAKLVPGKYEYQVQADFEYTCRYLGAKKMAFHTIAGAGPNGCMMHYMENEEVIHDGHLILLDLGAEAEHYASDITRTYPANGKFTPRQREYYELVLKANEAIVKMAKPGVTPGQLTKEAHRVVGEGLVAMGKISDVSEVGKYLMHGCSHCIGVDVHDINVGMDEPMEAGWVITNEPGVYVDEEEIGIRIEDDLLITEDGCIVLSKDIIKDPDDIEKFMAEHRG